MDDWELISQYVNHRSDEAFSTLAQRYLDLVYSAARRQVRDAEMAQDVAQAVFIVLAAKAKSLTPGTLLSAWLFKTTRYAANNAIKMQRRRQYHEQQAAAGRAEQMDNLSDGQVWGEITPHLDHAIASLNQADRDAILLRYFENQPLAQVGARLGVSADAAEKRVSRAVERLRAFLIRNGKFAALSIAALATLLASNAAMAAPSVASAAVSAPPSAAAKQIAKSTLRTMAAASFLAFRWSTVAAILLITAGLMAFVAMNITYVPRPQKSVVQVDDDGNDKALVASGPFTEVKSLPSHPSGAYAIALGPTGDLITAAPGPVVVGSYGAPKGDPSIIRFFNPGTGAEFRRLTVDFSPINALAISSDNALIAFAGGEDQGNRIIYVRDAKTNRSIFTLKAHAAAITALTFTGGNQLASASADRTVRLWNMETGDLIKVLPAVTASVTALAASPDGKSLALLDGQAIHVLDLNSLTIQQEIPTKNATAISLNANSELFWCDGELHKYDLKTHLEISKKPMPLPARNVAIGANGEQLLISATDNTVRLFANKRSD